MTTGTVRLHRVLRAPPERIYRAFLEPDAIAKWLPPYGFTCQVHHMDARVCGTHKMSFRNFSTCAEVTEGHLVCTTNTGIHVVDLAGEPVGREPLRYRIGFEEGSIDAFGRSAQDSMETDGSCSHV